MNEPTSMPSTIVQDGPWEHNLDMEAISNVQAKNAAELGNCKDQIIEKVDLARARGLYVGLKIHQGHGMDWLGAGLLSANPDTVGTPLWCNHPQLSNNAKLFPAFQQLKRPGGLPGKCRISVPKPETQAWIKKIWDGECVYHYTEDPSFVEEVCIANICVTTTNDETLVVFYAESSEIVRWKLHPDLQDLDFSETELLIARLLHHFLRQYAFMLPARLLETLVDATAFGTLTSKKCKEQFLDWQILRADLALNLPPLEDVDRVEPQHSKYIRRSLVRVACALVALDRWNEAAAIHVELAEIFNYDTDSYGLAARAFQFGSNPRSALEMIIKCLTRLVEQQDPNPNINENPYLEYLGNIVFLYHAMFEAYISSHDKSSNRPIELQGDEANGIAYVALLRLADCTALHQFEAEEMMFGVSKATARSTLKQKYRKAKMAKRALLTLLRSGSLEEFNNILSRIVVRGVPIAIRPKFNTEASDDLREFLAGGAKKSAQTIAKNSECTIRVCANCGEFKGAVDYMACPCNKVSYCSGECQQSDWKRHKKACSWYRKNKQDLKKKKDQLECSGCGKDTTTKPLFCPCRETCYCCKACQVSNWKEHKKVCKWQLEKKQTK